MIIRKGKMRRFHFNSRKWIFILLKLLLFGFIDFIAVKISFITVILTSVSDCNSLTIVTALPLPSSSSSFSSTSFLLSSRSQETESLSTPPSPPLETLASYSEIWFNEYNPIANNSHDNDNNNNKNDNSHNSENSSNKSYTNTIRTIVNKIDSDNRNSLGGNFTTKGHFASSLIFSNKVESFDSEKSLPIRKRSLENYRSSENESSFGKGGDPNVGSTSYVQSEAGLIKVNLNAGRNEKHFEFDDGDGDTQMDTPKNGKYTKEYEFSYKIVGTTPRIEPKLGDEYDDEDYNMDDDESLSSEYSSENDNRTEYYGDSGASLKSENHNFLDNIKNIWDIFVAVNTAWNTIAQQQPQQPQQEQSTLPQEKGQREARKQGDNRNYQQGENSEMEVDERLKRDSSYLGNSQKSSTGENVNSKLREPFSQNIEKDENGKERHHHHERLERQPASSTTEVAEGRYIKGDPLKGYYDFVITEGSYKFWACFQLATAILIIYSTFAAIYYSKVNPLVADYDYIDYLGGGRSLSDDTDFVDDDLRFSSSASSSSSSLLHRSNSSLIAAGLLHSPASLITNSSISPIHHHHQLETTKWSSLFPWSSSSLKRLSSLTDGYKDLILKTGRTIKFVLEMIDKIPP